MKLIAITAGVASAALMLAVAGSASAGQVVITNVDTGNGDLGNVSVPNNGNPWTTPILMTDSHGVVHVTFCDDLQHDVNVGNDSPGYVYQIGLVTVDGTGKALTESVSNVMGQIAALGVQDYKLYKSSGDFTYEDAAIGAQAAIWGIEYGYTNATNGFVASSDPTIQSFIDQYEAIKDNGKGWAVGLISQDGHQSQLLGGGVPEPASWAMMLLGVFGLGAVLRGRHKQEANTMVETAGA